VKNLLQLLLLLLCSSAVLAQPATMVKMVVQNVTPGTEADSADALTRTIYRQGANYARVEEAPSPRDGLHLVIIRAQTDSWQLDLNSQTALHQGGLPAEVSIPIFVDLYPLEFGREIEFMRDNEVEPEEIKLDDGTPALHFGARAGDLGVELIALKEGEVPAAIQFLDGEGKVLMRIQYLEYQRGLPSRPGLFVLPQGITVTEAAEAAE
jgi:hypothetical protein